MKTYEQNLRKLMSFTPEYGKSGYALDVSVVGLVEAPELQLYERPTWLGDFEECRPAHYANWRDLLAPPDTPAPAGTSAE